jgi:ATP-dependent RNA/DNA helicase IGHMBP2
MAPAYYFCRMDYFKDLLELLKIERKEDQESYKRLTESLSVNERRASGISWYPVAIRGSEMSRGDYLTVELERTTNQDIQHQLRFGMPASLFSNHNSKEDRVEGIISHISNNNLKLTLNTDELPEWSKNGKLGVDLLFDDNSYDEMAVALRSAMQLREKDESYRLVQILTGERAPGFNDQLPEIHIPRLNLSQLAAVKKILAANELAIVHGPPGTGKTTTLVQAILALIKQDRKQILVVAPSNTAVDLLSEKLSLEGLNVLRIGNPVRVSERLNGLTLDSRMATHERVKEMKTLRKQASEFRNMAHKYKRNFGKAEREQRKALFDEAYRIMKDVANIEQYIADDIIAGAQVIAATPVGANHYSVSKLRYHTVVIDEAGQALEPSCWIPVLKAQKLVLAGDHCQLPPTIKSEEAARKGLAVTLLEKCVALHPASVVLLNEQYRMNKLIMAYSSKVFYGGKLKADISVANHLLFEGDKPLCFVDTAGCGFDEKIDGTSSVNPEEASFLFKHFDQLIQQLEEHYQPGNFPTVAIISPYRQQVEILKNYFSSTSASKKYAGKISVNTIDSFQGQERDIVYISMTRSNSEGSIGFLSDIRRMNVAMTRARKKLVIVGDSATLSSFGFYLDLISFTETVDGYQSAWEFMT